jgi:hypothetical protein
MRITAKLDDGSKHFIRRLNGFGRRFQAEVVQATDTLGHALVNWTRQTIMEQNFAPLNEQYKAWKASHGYSELILIMTWQMYKSISYKRMVTSGSMVQGQIGFKQSSSHRSWRSYARYSDKQRMKNRVSRTSGSIPTAELGKWLEGYSDSKATHMPPRPFFEPTLQKHVDDIVGAYAAAFARAFGGIGD